MPVSESSLFSLLTPRHRFSRPYLSNRRAHGMVVVQSSSSVCRGCIVTKKRCAIDKTYVAVDH